MTFSETEPSIALVTCGSDNLLAMQALLLSYNIGVDREQERRKLMSDTAARVGLRMPQYAEEADRA